MMIVSKPTKHQKSAVIIVKSFDRVRTVFPEYTIPSFRLSSTWQKKPEEFYGDKSNNSKKLFVCIFFRSFSVKVVVVDYLFCL